MSASRSAQADANTDFEIREIRDALPDRLTPLRREALEEGYGFVERLYRDWDAGEVRFEEEDERLLCIWVDGEIAAIGGVTRDPSDQRCLRMRRFYVRAAFRRKGLARKLALSLLDILRTSQREIRVNAGTEIAPRFWESIGFEAVRAKEHTHILRRTDRRA